MKVGSYTHPGKVALQKNAFNCRKVYALIHFVLLKQNNTYWVTSTRHKCFVFKSKVKTPISIRVFLL